MLGREEKKKREGIIIGVYGYTNYHGPADKSETWEV
jgi:hypothetical protein